MQVCIAEHLDKYPEKYIAHARSESDGDSQLAEDSLQETLKKSYAPERLCKIERETQIYKEIDRYIKSERKIRKKMKDIPLDEIPAPSEFEDDKDFLPKLNLFREKIILFLKNRYPLTGHKYYFYIETWVYKTLNEETWEEVEKKFKGVDIQEVQSRRSEIMKEFKKYWGYPKQ